MHDMTKRMIDLDGSKLQPPMCAISWPAWPLAMHGSKEGIEIVQRFKALAAFIH